ncbi:hypothetical protein ACFPL7_13365 [Dongia soli]|uniref:Uncharacterized protein n=1 Tax=Dongia soli TaxID=600628 RepID=A0ABU5ECM0_9PROT|nr:hypothetical protein [Dongia soli]MDY0884110.1 hypothetical protein [Dongia soli]
MAGTERETHATERKQAKLAKGAPEARNELALEEARLRALEAEQEAQKIAAVEWAACSVKPGISATYR